MGVTVVYRASSEHARSVAEFLHDFERQTGKTLEELDPDTRQGTDVCRLYDIVEYPTIIATTAEGQLRNMWRGTPLPTIDEISYYVD